MEEYRSIEQLWLDSGNDLRANSRYSQLLQVPVKDLSTEQVRLLLSQDTGTVFLLERALQILENDILADGDFYPGDLLSAVLNISSAYWDHKPGIAIKLHALLVQRHLVVQRAGHKKLYRQVERFIKERLFIEQAR